MHSKCNLKARQSKFEDYRINCFFHNLSGFDHTFLLKYAQNNPEDNVDTVWMARTRGKKVMSLKGKYVWYKDSIKLLPDSLDSLGKSLPDNARITQKEFTKNFKGTDLCKKNLYPYDFVDSCKKLSDTKIFPSIDKFESSLKGKVKEADYLLAKKFYDDNFTNLLGYHDFYLEMVRIFLFFLFFMFSELEYYVDFFLSFFQKNLTLEIFKINFRVHKKRNKIKKRLIRLFFYFFKN